MLFSHISDIHLGLVQYASEEREQDIYKAFNESIDTSIKDHVDFVIFAGDIFHVPTPSGTAILAAQYFALVSWSFGIKTWASSIITKIGE